MVDVRHPLSAPHGPNTLLSTVGLCGFKMRTPKISLVAYAEQQWIFVLDPSSYGRYLRTDPCVAYNGCTHCGAVCGEPCFQMYRRLNKTGQYEDVKKYHSATHCKRRDAKRPPNYRSYKPKRDDLPLIDESVEVSE